MHFLAHNAEIRRQAAAATMHRIAASAAEAQLRAFTGDAGGSEWEDELLAILRARTSEPFLAGEGDAGHRFVFSPSTRAGFWTLSSPNLRGKGQIRPAGIDALTTIAQERGLLERSPF